MWQALASWVAGGAAAGTVLGLARLVYRMHLDAMTAQAKALNARADAYREIASYERQRADLRERQLGDILDRASERL